MDGDCYRYHTPPNGFKPDDYFHGPDCCTGSGHRIVAMLPWFLYGRGQERDLREPIRALTAKLRLPMAARDVERRPAIPKTAKMLIRVEPERKAKFAINVRLPAWCEEPAVAVDGEAGAGQSPETYARLERAWKAGDTIELTLPMQPRWIGHEHLEGGPIPVGAGARTGRLRARHRLVERRRGVPAPFDAGREIGHARDKPEVRELPPGPRALGPFYETEVSSRTAGRRGRASSLQRTLAAGIGTASRDPRGQARPSRTRCGSGRRRRRPSRSSSMSAGASGS